MSDSGRMPDKMVGNWLRLEGDKFREANREVDVLIAPSCRHAANTCRDRLCLLSPMGEGWLSRDK